MTFIINTLSIVAMALALWALWRVRKGGAYETALRECEKERNYSVSFWMDRAFRLEKYARHRYDCTMETLEEENPGRECSCGLDKLLAERKERT